MQLKPNQQLFIQARAAGATIIDAALAAGVSEMTAHRWLKLPEIQQALQASTTNVLEDASEIIKRYYRQQLEKSCSVVIEIAQNDEAPAAARLKAVQMIHERLAPASTVEGSVDASTDQGKGIDWGIFTDEELAIIQPIFKHAEERAQASTLRKGA